MRTLSITMQEELYYRLKRLVPQRQVSKFVTQAVEEKLDEKREELYNSYREAYQDQDREAEIKVWSAVDVETWQ